MAPNDSVGLRTCVGCGAKQNRRNLLRFTALAGILTYDEKQRLSGRGVYCCRKSGCVKRFAVRKRQTAKILRQELTDYRVVPALLGEGFWIVTESSGREGKEF